MSENNSHDLNSVEGLQSALAEAEQTNHDLAVFLMQFIHRAWAAGAPTRDSLREKATEYLKRKNLLGSAVSTMRQT